jgi:PAS domain S-box-containing protein
MQKMRLNLVLKTFLAAALGVSLVWGFYIYDIDQTRDSLISRAKVSTKTDAEAFSEFSIASIKRIDELLLDIQTHWHGNIDSFSQYVSSKQEVIKDITFQVVIIDDQGIMTFSTLMVPGKKVDLSDREHVKVHKENPTINKLFISRPLIGRVSGKWTIQFTRPIFVKGRNVGVIVISIDPAYFGQFGSKLDISDDGELSIVRSTGERIARYPIEDGTYNQKFLNLPFQNSSAPSSGNFQLFSPLDGVDRIYGYRNDNEYGLSFLVGEDVHLILAPYYAHRKMMLLLCGFATFLILVIAVVFYRSSRQKEGYFRALELSQESLRLINAAITNANDIVMITEAALSGEPGAIVYVNDAFVIQTGYTRDEAIGGSSTILRGPKTDLAALRKIHDARLQWKSIKIELINYRKDGTEFWVEADISPIADASGGYTHWISIQRDITDRKVTRAREQLINATIQKELLFGDFPERLADHKLALYSVPSQVVDGDFYLVSSLTEDMFEVLTGDVMGKGINAAMVGAGVKNTYLTAYRSLVLNDRIVGIPTASNIVNKMHALLMPKLFSLGMFVTLSLLRFDRRTNTVTIVNAGDPPTMIIRKSTHTIEDVLGNNIPLGILDNEVYEEQTIHLQSGDQVAIFSDGLIDASNRLGINFGLDRLRDSLLAGSRGNVSVAETLGAVKSDLVSFMQGRPLGDDTSLILVGAPERSEIVEAGVIKPQPQPTRRSFDFLTEGVFHFQTLSQARDLAYGLARSCPHPKKAMLGLFELLVNAVEHGNLALNYDDKSRLLAEGKWDQEIEHRAVNPPYSDRRVTVIFNKTDTEIRFQIQDEGSGFAWERFMEISPERMQTPHGRGIAIARMTSFDSVEYMGSGNIVIATISLAK